MRDKVEQRLYENTVELEQLEKDETIWQNLGAIFLALSMLIIIISFLSAPFIFLYPSIWRYIGFSMSGGLVLFVILFVYVGGYLNNRSQLEDNIERDEKLLEYLDGTRNIATSLMNLDLESDE